MKNLLIIAAFLGLGATAYGQATQTATQATEVVINQILDITYTAGNATETFTFTSEANFDNGISTATDVSSLAVKSNKAFSVAVSAPDFTITSGSSTTPMPATVLSVTADAGSNYTTVTNGGANLVTGGSIGTSSYDIGFKAEPGYDYEPSTYGTTITFTVSAP